MFKSYCPCHLLFLCVIFPWKALLRTSALTLRKCDHAPVQAVDATREAGVSEDELKRLQNLVG